jgi:hypothetical protein
MCSPPVYIYPRYKTRSPSTSFSSGWSSPTFSHESRDLWASKHIRSLHQLHQYLPPTHWATLKFNRIETVATINQFLKSLTKAVAYFNTKSGQHIALFGNPHTIHDGTVHYHLLIRTSVVGEIPFPGEGNTLYLDPTPFLRAKIDKFNRTNGTIISLPYCERPNSGEATSKYGLQLGNHEAKLFESHLKMRFSYQCGGYFPKRTKKKHYKQGVYEWVRFKHEQQTDAIVCNFEDFASVTPDKTPEPVSHLPSSDETPATVAHHQERPTRYVIFESKTFVQPLNVCRRPKGPPKIRSPCTWPQNRTGCVGLNAIA